MKQHRKKILTALLLIIPLLTTTEVNARNYQANESRQQYKGLNNRFGRHLLSQDAQWYKTEEAREIADNVILYQNEHGAWPKNTNLAKEPESEEYLHEKRTGSETNTIDNNATTRPMKFLALMYNATQDENYKEAFLRGLNYLLEAQYQNGGWPQFYPLRESGYYSEITFNDNAMMNVMFLLREIAQENEPYKFVDTKHRAKAEEAVERGIDCILKTQIEEDGALKAWCAQYNEKTLEPAWARSYEPPSISGSESVSVVRFLMEIESPSPEVIKAVDSAIAWFKKVKINGLRYHHGRNEDGERDSWVTPDSTAGALWARFYELETNRPIFLGRDSEFHYKLSEVEQERRAGYAYYGRWPQDLVEKYPAWKEKHQ